MHAASAWTPHYYLFLYLHNDIYRTTLFFAKTPLTELLTKDKTADRQSNSNWSSIPSNTSLMWSHQALINCCSDPFGRDWELTKSGLGRRAPPTASCGTSLAGAGQLASLHRDNYHRAKQSWRLFLASSNPHLRLHETIDPSLRRALRCIQLGQSGRRSRGCANIPSPSLRPCPSSSPTKCA
jgi:hypothetical protein